MDSRLVKFLNTDELRRIYTHSSEYFLPPILIKNILILKSKIDLNLITEWDYDFALELLIGIVQDASKHSVLLNEWIDYKHTYSNENNPQIIQMFELIQFYNERYQNWNVNPDTFESSLKREFYQRVNVFDSENPECLTQNISTIITEIQEDHFSSIQNPPVTFVKE